MNAMAVNKVVYGTTVLVDLTEDTVTADKLLKGATAHNAAGEPVTGEMEPSIDTSDATATPDDMREGTTAYVNGDKVTGTIPLWNGINWDTPTAIWDSKNKRLTLRGSLSARRMIKKDSISTMHCSGEKLGDATAADVVSGKTFTSADGLKIAGAVPSKDAASYTPGTEDQIIASGQYLSGDQTIKGDSNLLAENIKSGVSIFGVTGTYEGSSGSGGGIQAQHITSGNETITISGTGTVKVWGYGHKSGGYTGTTYSFVGDGYYSGGYGTPSKTSVTFSISNGKLSGLPSGLQSVDLLVTIGV